MWSYTLRRIIGSVPTLFVLCVITFFMMRVAPGGPFSGNRRVSPEFIRAVEDHYHLHDPLPQHARHFMAHLREQLNAP